MTNLRHGHRGWVAMQIDSVALIWDPGGACPFAAVSLLLLGARTMRLSLSNRA